jgi:uncharacterized protein (TIGR00369 family)
MDLREIMETVIHRGHSRLLGMRYIDHGADWAELAIDYQKDFVGVSDEGLMASGPVFTLMDMAAGMAVLARMGEPRPQVTLDLRVDYLRAAKPGSAITGRAECYRLARRVAFVRGIAQDGTSDIPVAHIAATFMLIDEE